MYKVSSGTLNLYFVTARISSQLSSTTFVTIKNCRLVSTANHIQYEYYARYARDLIMGYARRPAAYRAAPGINYSNCQLAYRFDNNTLYFGLFTFVF